MPRVFIALRFSDEFKQTLVALQNALKERGVQGEYCPCSNLHMTLAFCKENLHLLPQIRKAVREVLFAPFTITLDKLGLFPTRDGVIWAGIKESEPASSIAKRLRERLDANGVPYASTPFYPHISLLKRPSRVVTDIEVPPATCHVQRLCIMKSERMGEELLYSEID